MGIDEYKEITKEWISRDIASAVVGDRDAAIRLIEHFEYCVLSAKPIPEEVQHYFASCFRKILAGDDPAQSLNIEKPRHRPEDREKWLRDVKLAIQTEELRHSGWTLEQAISEVARNLHASESTVRRAYKYYKY